MKIHKGFLTHDATTGGVGKLLDLGFNGDFDYKNHTWNMLFVQIPSREAAYTKESFPITVSLITANSLDDEDGGTIFATLAIPWNASYAKGGVAFFPMPKGLKRYFTMSITGAGEGTKFTAGITDGEDTAVTPGMNWTYYKADTSTSEAKGIMSEAMEKLFPEANT